jgi:asparagine synthase (glutamine-hydrolysing)
MCGIAGYVSAPGNVANPFLIKEMCDRIRHRGPDGEGSFHDGPAALGHRRLSIIDVAGGAQPLGNEDGSIQIVFNGEIYNYLELRADLVRKGHQFSTRSDTEVLVHLYEEVGEQLPALLNGMFAFAIWDSRKGELFLARDRFGKKPLYYSTAVPGFRICFASELKALTVIPGFDSTVEARSVADFLSFAYVPDPATIYRDVSKLAPGSSLLLTRDGARTRKYWSLPFQVDQATDFSRSMAAIRELAADSVERRMISDVPLGGFLSGGVDSSSVVAFMAERAGHTVKSFTIGFTDEEFDETRFARMVAERYRTEHHEEIVSRSIHEILRTLVEHYDEPFADNSAIPTLYLSRMTRQHVTVALSGDGADELFGGYRRYRMALAADGARRRMPRWLRRSVIGKAGEYYPKLDRWPQVFRAKTTLLEIGQSLGEAYGGAMSGFRFGMLDRVLSPELRRELGDYSPIGQFAGRFEKYRDLAPLQQLQAVDLETYLPGDILVKLDRATMAYSLEARCPLLDHRLGELAGTLPTAFQIRGGSGKRIFKEAVAPYLPPEILARQKWGFGSPRSAWFRTSLKQTFEDVVMRPEMDRYLEPGAVKQIWQAHQSGVSEFGRELWALLMLGCWHDRHVSKSRGDVLAEAAQ